MLAAPDSFRAAVSNAAPALTKGEPPLSDLRLKLYERALARDPRNHFLLLDLAREYGRHLRIVDAQRMLERLLELYPTSALIRTQAAAAYAAVGLPLRAIEQFRCSLRIDPHQPDAPTIRKIITRLGDQLSHHAVR